MIAIHKVNKSFRGRQILKDITFDISEGECIGLLGPNGAGKTTLIKCITGIIHYEDGEITFHGKDILNFKNDIGYLSQNTDFKQWMTCEESLRFFGSLSGLSKAYLDEHITDVLTDVGLKDKNKYKVEELSGGMKQRLGIAQAILHRPKLLILDEPVSALDPIGRSEIKNLIQKLKTYTTILISTHILDDASEFCDRYIIIKNGEIVGNITNQDETINKKQVYFQVNAEETAVSPVKLNESYVLQEIKPGQFSVTSKEPIVFANLMKELDKHHIQIHSLAYEKKDVEKIFLELVSEV
ncbi:ABC transporter ATP-binding protein [Gracilibacillus alcaliphilus]|uniref:ABC transporter ATP-binding protein n=1 Tax=Gracilibacillus alcaliphilus TaxID=1401441 RepID=UPI00195DDE69|nr:ABC transporter ATP-binding protein [Gracilibacillus alcaliphilus]MBM7677447.1 ABC-2 type transport system ATP-binding protein [Gracilibacillus alcaliphilus]